jgi:hypothetical protein
MESNFQPLIAAPYNEYSGQVAAAAVQTAWAASGNTNAWYPPLITDLRSDGNTATLVAQIGQYQPASNQLRIYDRLAVEIFYNDSADQTPPTIHLVNSLYGSNRQVQVKVGATDGSGIHQVTVAYINADDPNRLLSQDLTFDAAAQVWSGVFTGGPGTRFFVQVVDQAGNVTTAHNKGRYYTPGDGSARTLPLPGCTGRCLFLPVVRR